MKLKGFGVFREKKEHIDRRDVRSDPFTGRTVAGTPKKNVVISDVMLPWITWWRVRDGVCQPDGKWAYQYKEAGDWRLLRFSPMPNARYWLFEKGELTRLFWVGPEEPLKTYGEFNAYVLGIEESEDDEGGEPDEV